LFQTDKETVLSECRKKTVTFAGIGLMAMAMIARSKGNILMCTDMTKGRGVSLSRKEKS